MWHFCILAFCPILDMNSDSRILLSETVRHMHVDLRIDNSTVAVVLTATDTESKTTRMQCYTCMQCI